MSTGDKARDNWQHNPQHRGNAPYGDRGTANKFGANNRQRPGGGDRAGRRCWRSWWRRGSWWPRWGWRSRRRRRCGRRWWCRPSRWCWWCGWRWRCRKTRRCRRCWKTRRCRRCWKTRWCRRSCGSAVPAVRRRSRETRPAVAELEHGPVEAEREPDQVAVPLRIKLVIAVHHRDLVPLLAAAEDLAAAVETTRDPAATEAATAWVAAV